MKSVVNSSPFTPQWSLSLENFEVLVDFSSEGLQVQFNPKKKAAHLKDRKVVYRPEDLLTPEEVVKLQENRNWEVLKAKRSYGLITWVNMDLITKLYTKKSKVVPELPPRPEELDFLPSIFLRGDWELEFNQPVIFWDSTFNFLKQVQSLAKVLDNYHINHKGNVIENPEDLGFIRI